MDQGMLYRLVGQRVREARTDRKVTQDNLAKAISLTRTSIANIEHGRQKLLLHTLCDIAAALQVEPATLIPDLESCGELREPTAEDRENLSAEEWDWIRSTITDSTKRG